MIIHTRLPFYVLGRISDTTVLVGPVTEGFTLTEGLNAIAPIEEKKQGPKQSILEILGARLVTNELLESGPQEESDNNVQSEAM